MSTEYLTIFWYVLLIYLFICFLTYLFTYLFIHSLMFCVWIFMLLVLFVSSQMFSFISLECRRDIKTIIILKSSSASISTITSYLIVRNWFHAIIFYLVFLAIYFLKFRNGCSLLIFHIVLLATLDLNCLKSFYIKKVSYTIPQNVDLVKDWKYIICSLEFLPVLFYSSWMNSCHFVLQVHFSIKQFALLLHFDIKIVLILL